MRTIILIIGIASAILFFNTNALADGNSLPSGYYLGSCDSCSINGHDLSCSCRAQNGNWVNATVRVTRHCKDVINNNGYLQCDHYSHHHRHHHHHHHHYRNKIVDISAGPIWNNADAQQKCPSVCVNSGANWTGQWNTVAWGQNSVCECSMIVR